MLQSIKSFWSHRRSRSDVLSLTRGRHTLKFGGDVNSIHELLVNLFQGGGVQASPYNLK